MSPGKGEANLVPHFTGDVVLAKYLYLKIFFLAVDCGRDFGVPENGRADYDTTTFGSRVQYSCNPGFALNTSNNLNVSFRQCLAGGVWSGATPTCAGS